MTVVTRRCDCIKPPADEPAPPPPPPSDPGEPGGPTTPGDGGAGGGGTHEDGEETRPEDRRTAAQPTQIDSLVSLFLDDDTPFDLVAVLPHGCWLLGDAPVLTNAGILRWTRYDQILYLRPAGAPTDVATLRHDPPATLDHYYERIAARADQSPFDVRESSSSAWPGQPVAPFLDLMRSNRPRYALASFAPESEPDDRPRPLQPDVLAARGTIYGKTPCDETTGKLGPPKYYNAYKKLPECLQNLIAGHESDHENDPALQAACKELADSQREARAAANAYRNRTSKENKERLRVADERVKAAKANWPGVLKQSECNAYKNDAECIAKLLLCCYQHNNCCDCASVKKIAKEVAAGVKKNCPKPKGKGK